MKIKVLIGILVFLIVLNLATIGTWVYLHVFKSPIPRAPRVERLLQRPLWSMRRRPPLEDLTPEQRQQLGNLFREMRRQKQPVEKRLREIHLRLREALLDTTVTEDSLRSLLDSLVTLQRQLNEITIEHFLKARHFLTPEQQKRIFRHLLIPGTGPHTPGWGRRDNMPFFNNRQPKQRRIVP